MARPLRLEYPGAVYHVTARGNARQAIFADDADREKFLAILGATVGRYHWLCHAYCLMGNHYHLLLETPEPNLSLGMRMLNGVYTQAYNRNHGVTGHVFQGRYKAVLIEKEAHLLELCRYIVLNPVAAGMVTGPEHWPWSSYRGTISEGKAPDFLTTNWILAQFAGTKAKAREAYRSFVGEGKQIQRPWAKLTGQIFLGSATFVEQAGKMLGDAQLADEIPRLQRYAGRPSLVELFAGCGGKAERNALIRQAHLAHGYTLKEIAVYLGLHYNTVSKAFAKAGQPS
ncbi:transposase [Desulfurivibrio sp. D14AmB]|uniref:transposase n=1 Tax=Desulfurivibrio sp. D14AmB TaxID=3374370 RepID=UPI00376ECB12